jgi:hypothetical protein
MKKQAFFSVLILAIACSKAPQSTTANLAETSTTSQSSLTNKIVNSTELECALTTLSGNKYFLVTNFSDESNKIELHDLEGKRYLPNLEINGRYLPPFTNIQVKDKKRLITAVASEENIDLDYGDVDQNDNPDKMKNHLRIKAINYKIVLPKTSDGEGEIQRAYVYNKRRGFMGSQGRVGDYKVIANIVDCKPTDDYTPAKK